ncbi:MAG: VOC family protein [Bacteroidia bacterium]|nr:VOC family protein [Bacteroidia bacterium]
MEKKIISGIQQIGIGIPNVHQAWAWYREYFGMDIPIFEEAAEAELMLPYTGGEPRSRHAILAVNLQGGGGFEIWQYTSRVPVGPEFEPQLGDLGIFITRIKSDDVEAAYEFMKEKGAEILSGIQTDPSGNTHFFVKDPYQNIFQVIGHDTFFGKSPSKTGGPAGCMIGVSDIEKARKLYTDILGYDLVVYDEEGVFDDFANLPGSSQKVRRVLLTHSQPREGAFSRLIGPTYLELVVGLERTPKKIFQDRFWGDLGFIHLCFDIVNMEALKQECEEAGFPFTVDSTAALGGDFDMGEASGNFSYIEDPDGTLIEFVETLKMPIAKKLGWYLDLKKRDPKKPLPDWMLKALRINRVK